MPAVKSCTIPDNAFLKAYANTKGCYTDCYTTNVRGIVTLSEFVTAFYTTWLFKIERVILKFAVSKPSTDHQARQLGTGQIDRFAAWSVEKRADDQLLMCDFLGRTRSWFMVDHFTENSGQNTRLSFGTAVVPTRTDKTGQPTSSYGFETLVWFHRLYSRALLSTARSRIYM